jgi:hypothetical protein
MKEHHLDADGFQPRERLPLAVLPPGVEEEAANLLA